MARTSPGGRLAAIMTAPPTFPPPRHLTRDLAVHIRREGGIATLTLPIVPALLDASGRLRIGVAAMVADIISGEAAVREALPGWIATLGLSIQTGELPAEGHLTAVPARSERDGRRSSSKSTSRTRRRGTRSGCPRSRSRCCPPGPTSRPARPGPRTRRPRPISRRVSPASRLPPRFDRFHRRSGRPVRRARPEDRLRRQYPRRHDRRRGCDPRGSRSGPSGRERVRRGDLRPLPGDPLPATREDGARSRRRGRSGASRRRASSASSCGTKAATTSSRRWPRSSSIAARPDPAVRRDQPKASLDAASGESTRTTRWVPAAASKTAPPT